MPGLPRITTIAFPTSELLHSIESFPSAVTGVVWDFRSDPVGAPLEQIDAVVLPYLNASAVLPALRFVPNLKLVHTQTTGYDGVLEAVGPGVAVASASGTHAAATAELAIALILASLRGLKDAVLDAEIGEWRPRRRTSLADRRVLLLGVGGIGAEIADRLRPFAVELTRVGSTPRDDKDGHVYGTDKLIELARNAEIMVIVTPLNERTHHLIDADVLAALPDGALVVNVARGPVVDSDALTAEVVSGRISCALDVFDPEPIPADHPLWKAPNALITPHVGGNTSAFEVRIVELLQRQVMAFANDAFPENLVQPGHYVVA